MNAEPIESLVEKIMNRYNKRPLGWATMMDLKGNVLVLGPEEGYMLKLITINPQEHTGVGMEIDNPREIRGLVEGAPGYGFRPLSTAQVEGLLRSFRQPQQGSRFISEVLEEKPLPTWELKRKRPRAVLSGPVIAHPDLSTISRSQMQLESKLRIEAEKLFGKKYPDRAAIYR